MLRSTRFHRISLALLAGAFALAACEPDTRRRRSSDDDDGGKVSADDDGSGGSTFATGVGGGATIGAGGATTTTATTATTTTSTTTGGGVCQHPFDFSAAPSCGYCLEDFCCAETAACGNDGVCAACLTGQQSTGCDQNAALINLSNCAFSYCEFDCG